MACGLATLKTLKESNPYPRLEAETRRLADGLAAAAQAAGLPHTVARCGSMFTLFFHGEKITSYATATRCDTARFSKYFWGMIERGVYLPCSQFEANFVSSAHAPADIDATIAAAQNVLRSLA
jgi:glutamate-1-semialdehyde 2,1-aminomutase